ncbi:MAG: DUF2905 domain-containing protein [Tindallia sp. MSAO_Bac2]|nr:MAG: DUF2905 domain-containing protein [Tindallia sp. MSAO_Bac2]
MEQMARTMIIIGLLVAVAGFIFLIAGRIGLGRLPGDFMFRRGNATFYFPLATSIIVSLLLTLLLNLLFRK